MLSMSEGYRTPIQTPALTYGKLYYVIGLQIVNVHSMSGYSFNLGTL
jgi:hypothetical protein